MALVAVVFLTACSPGGSGGDHSGGDHFGDDQRTAPVKQAAYRPQYVYQKYCAPCHDATNLHLIQDPPRLDGLFRKRAGLFLKKTFPSGAPATDDELRNVILHGEGTMPPFEGTLSGDDVDGLVRYMHTR
jgi:cytochrome c5